MSPALKNPLQAVWHHKEIEPYFVDLVAMATKMDNEYICIYYTVLHSKR